MAHYSGMQRKTNRRHSQLERKGSRSVSQCDHADFPIFEIAAVCETDPLAEFKWNAGKSRACLPCGTFLSRELSFAECHRFAQPQKKNNETSPVSTKPYQSLQIPSSKQTRAPRMLHLGECLRDSAAGNLSFLALLLLTAAASRLENL